MTKKTLSDNALLTINNFLHLPITGRDVSCPYFNNERQKMRAGLRVLIGKGSPDDIQEEARIICMRDKIDFSSLDNYGLKHFLVEQNLGIDCSALVYYIIDAECRARGIGALAKLLKFPTVSNPWRKLLTKLRPVENTGVETIAHNNNSHSVTLENAAPGDLIIMLNTGYNQAKNHVLIIHEVENLQDNSKILRYTHSFKWKTDGRYDHGARQGQIEVKDINAGLLDQKWIEKGVSGTDNETFEHARLAETLLLKRLNFF